MLTESIFKKVALKKMYNYSMVKILETEVAGQAVAIMLKAFSAVGIPNDCKTLQCISDSFNRVNFVG